ncbi:hypothetical protein TCAL_16170 [Tigriopus californicus]|uniref:Uncharacterized protein n=1 Tax=Tigriopus californicus TaxID=6832 RepID=A0A553P3R1_TIGCA|nr:hypothetical protein TCAL_16170 [Tigriopus californicus]
MSPSTIHGTRFIHHVRECLCGGGMTTVAQLVPILKDGWWNTDKCRLLKFDANGTYVKHKVKGGVAAVEEFWK